MPIKINGRKFQILRQTDEYYIHITENGMTVHSYPVLKENAQEVIRQHICQYIFDFQNDLATYKKGEKDELLCNV